MRLVVTAADPGLRGLLAKVVLDGPSGVEEQPRRKLSPAALVEPRNGAQRAFDRGRLEVLVAQAIRPGRRRVDVLAGDTGGDLLERCDLVTSEVLELRVRSFSQRLQDDLP